MEAMGAFGPWLQLGAVGVVCYLVVYLVKQQASNMKMIIDAHEKTNNALVEEIKEMRTEFVQLTRQLDEGFQAIDRRLAAMTGKSGNTDNFGRP